MPDSLGSHPQRLNVQPSVVGMREMHLGSGRFSSPDLGKAPEKAWEQGMANEGARSGENKLGR